MRARATPEPAERVASKPAPVVELQAMIRQILASIAGDPEHSTQSLRTLRRRQSRTLKPFPAITVLRLACELAEPRGDCPRWFAYELVHHHAAAMSRLTSAWLNRFGSGLSSWDEVDPFACYLLGPAWRSGYVTDAHITRWARSKDRWRRRAALVATVALNTPARGGSGDAVRTLGVCTLLLEDRDDMVIKALSWALRALAARTPQPVRNFLEQHRERLAAQVQREVRNKLTSGLKTPRRAKLRRKTSGRRSATS
jgi:3-methyladenine DNA glycosylase AlkD